MTPFQFIVISFTGSLIVAGIVYCVRWVKKQITLDSQRMEEFHDQEEEIFDNAMKHRREMRERILAKKIAEDYAILPIQLALENYLEKLKNDACRCEGICPTCGKQR